MPAVQHVVAFKVKDEANLPALSRSMLALKDKCVRDGKPYIVSSQGGKQVNDEGFDDGMQVVFLVEFKDESDWEYYVNEDPQHLAFKEEISAYGVAGVTVLDFVNNQW